MIPNGPACAVCVMGGCTERYKNPPGDGFMTSDGKMTSGVMIVAEALGKEEAKQGKALVGPSGFLLGRVMSRKKWSRDFFRYSNALYCQPFKNTIRDRKGFYLPWAEEALEHCPYMDEEIDRYQPKVIVAFGETAFEKLTGERLRMMAARGYVFREKKGRCWVIPTFHPAYILRGNQHLALVLQMDLEKAVRIAQEGFEYEEGIECLEDPNIGEWEEFVEDGRVAVNAGIPLALDIETPFKRDLDEDELEVLGELEQIDRVSFAFGPNKGASVMWGMPYLPGIRRLIEEAIRKSKLVIWNRSFDRPRVAAALKISIPIESTRDTMDAWHVLYNAFPKKLGFATSLLPSGHRLRAWKHLSMIEPGYYSVMDAIALWRDDSDVMRMLSETGQMQVYKDICEELDPVLERMSLAGMLVDEKAKETLRVVVSERMDTISGRMTASVPVEVRNMKIWKTEKAQVKGLKLLISKGLVDKEARTVILSGQVKVKVCASCGELGVKKTHVTRKTIQNKE